MARLTLNEKERVPTGEYGTVYKMKGFNAIPEKRALTRPQLRSGPDFEKEYTGRKLSEKVINPFTGEVLYEAGTELTPEILQDMSNHEIEWVDVDGDDEEPKLQVKDVDDHYNGSFVDAGVLSGMLTDNPEIRNATIKWMKGLTGNDLDELNKIISSQTFKEMYGDPDWEDTEQDEYAKGFADVQNSEDPTAPAGKSNSYYDGWNDGLFEKSNTKVGSIAKALTANDLGRSL